MNGMSESDFVDAACRALGGRSWSLTAPAKINLRLKVLGRRSDGYHSLSMLNASVSLCDELTLRFELSSPSIVQCVGQESTDVNTEDNLIFRAYELFWHVCGITTPPLPLQAVVHKRIPVGGGLGGGSSDAAALLRFLVEALGPLLEQHGLLSRSVLQEKVYRASLRLGADIPYALRQGVCWVQGVGECVSRVEVPDLDRLTLVLTVPRESVPTKEFYDYYRRNKALPVGECTADSDMKAVDSGEVPPLDQLFSNDFEPYISKFRPQIAQQLHVAREFFSMTSYTGSGSVFFSVVRSDSQQKIMKYRSEVEKLGAAIKIVKVI